MIDTTAGTSGAVSPSSAPRTVVSVLGLNPRKFGSMEEYMALLSRALQERGWRSVLVLPEAVPPEVLRHFEGSGAIFEILPEMSGGKGDWSLRHTLRKHAPDAVHFHFCSFFSLYPIIAWLSGVRLIVFSQHSRLSERASRTRGLKGLLWDCCVLRPTGTQILTVAAHLKSTLVDAYRLNSAAIQVLYNGVNLHRFEPAEREAADDLRRQFGIGASSPVVLAAAYLVPGKGIHDLVSAAPAVIRDKEDTIFVVVGDGPELETLRQLAHALGVAEAFRFPGLRSDVNRFMTMADVVVFPSVFSESAGLVAVEAMAAARPVVATRVGGLPELVADGVTGILVDPQAPQQLASALLRLLTEPGVATAMGSAGRERAEKYYSADRWINDTIAFYEKNLS
jgi:glycosyltransferase involved in cell wall biosynthesis